MAYPEMAAKIVSVYHVRKFKRTEATETEKRRYRKETAQLSHGGRIQ